MERQARKRTALDNGGEKARGRKDGRGVVGWRLIFCSLASASSSASGRPHFARGATKGGEGPSIILSSVSLFSSSSSFPLLLAPVVSDLAFAASTILENVRDDDVVSIETSKKTIYSMTNRDLLYQFRNLDDESTQ